MDNKEKTVEVRNWWNTNPFTYNKSIGVGKTVEVADMDIAFFDRMNARYMKHSGNATQDADKPVFSKFIEYSSLKGKKVLDIAVGTGFSTVTFAQHGADVTAIDLTDYAVEATTKNLALRGLHGTVKRMDAQTLEFPDATFDFVCAHGCLMHMPDTDKAVREMYRVLKPEGKVYAWMYHRGWYYWFNIMLLRGVFQGDFLKYGWNPLKMTSKYTDGLHMGGNPHTKLYSYAKFRALFAQAGFKEIKVYINYSPHEWQDWPMKLFPIGHKIIPRGVQRFLSEKWRFGFGASITATKK